MVLWPWMLSACEPKPWRMCKSRFNLIRTYVDQRSGLGVATSDLSTVICESGSRLDCEGERHGKLGLWMHEKWLDRSRCALVAGLERLTAGVVKVS